LSLAVVVSAVLLSVQAGAQGPSAPDERPAPDLVEAVQARAWTKKGAFALTPLLAAGLDDPFLAQGGAGLRLGWWPRSLVGITIEASGWLQGPSDAARVAQRELRARLRSAGSPWTALAAAEVSAADGKLALGGDIVPFEFLLRLGAGGAAASEEPAGPVSLLLSAGVGMRWFLGASVGLETNLVWRSASLTREIAGQVVSGRDTVVALELGVPLRLGGGR
jgi:hypothetical protein